MSVLKSKLGYISIGVKWIDKPNAINVYIGRGSPLGNPFVIGTHGTRDEVCDKYETYLNQTTEPEVIRTLDKLVQLVRMGENINLQCYCQGKRCHGETIKNYITLHI